MKDHWCTEKCCCHHHYCGIKSICDEPFQCLCLACKFKSPFFECIQPAAVGFCWFKCLCSGEGWDCAPFPQILWDPLQRGKCFCIEFACGAQCSPCIDIMKDNWCEDKCCCFKGYCGIGPICGDTVQLCCLKFTMGKGTGGADAIGTDSISISSASALKQ